MFEEGLLDNYTDEQLLQYFQQSPFLITTRNESVRILSPGLIVKPYPSFLDYSDELSALELAHTRGVRVPGVRRVVRSVENGNHLLIMDRIHGLTLEQLWPNLGWWDTFRVAWQLRSFLCIMRSITSQTTGGLHTGITRSEWLQDVYGPTLHASPSAFSGYVNWWLLECRPSWCKPRPELMLEPAPEHIFVHQDLAPRNMILDDAGKLWVVDWGHAGFYPAYMEYMGLETTSMPWINAPTWAAWWARMRWSFFRWIAAGPVGPHKKPRHALFVVYERSIRYRLDKTPYSRVEDEVFPQ